MDDIIEEIFLHLPVNSLTRCKCLSKKWNNLISFNTSFRQKYLSRLTLPLMVGFFFNRYLVCVDEYEVDDNKYQVRFLPTCNKEENGKVGGKAWGSPPLPLPPDESLSFLGHREIIVSASSNGFLLCQLEESHPMHYYVCNPVTREWVDLPTPKMTSTYVYTGFICQGNCSFLSMVSYKVVRGLCPDFGVLSSTLTVEIFSSESINWKVLVLSCPDYFFLNLSGPSVVISEEGVVHWQAVIDEAHLVGTDLDGVVVFDPRKECLQCVAVPGNRFTSRTCVSMSNGLILLSRYYTRGHKLETWVLENGGDDYRKQWSLKHKVSLEASIAKFTFPRGCLRLIGLHPLNPLVFFLKASTDFEDKLIWCDLESSGMELISDFAHQGKYDHDFFVHVLPTLPTFFA